MWKDTSELRIDTGNAHVQEIFPSSSDDYWKGL